jgi:5-methyltetrahydropteroyltriglutamate--homocysteine methyltransferase
MQLQPLTTTTIGSFPRPAWLAATDRSRATFRLEGEGLREAQDDATLLTLSEQEELGLDIVTDGEQRREGFIFHMARTWDGVDLVNPGRKDTYRRRNAPRTVPRIIGRIVRRAPSTVEDLRFVKAHTRAPVKMALAGPMTVIDSALNEAYADEAELAMDIAAAVNAELLDPHASAAT